MFSVVFSFKTMYVKLKIYQRYLVLETINLKIHGIKRRLTMC